jgi:2-phospho-L-lactate guanylyltransferase (CobY/MobA/RfbA family)
LNWLAELGIRGTTHASVAVAVAAMALSYYVGVFAKPVVVPSWRNSNLSQHKSFEFTVDVSKTKDFAAVSHLDELDGAA